MDNVLITIHSNNFVDLLFISGNIYTSKQQLKSLIDCAEACIANSQYLLCAEALQSAGVAFSKFEHEIFSVADENIS